MIRAGHLRSALVKIRPLSDADRAWASSVLTERWGSPDIVTRGRVHRADRLPGFIALVGGEPLGLITYCISGPECEIISLDSLAEGRGIGTALLRAVEDEARRSGVRRLWLVTTNDNRRAISFYGKRGFRFAAVHAGAVRESRRLKPSIPETGMDGIPIRDEMEMEMILRETE